MFAVKLLTPVQQGSRGPHWDKTRQLVKRTGYNIDRDRRTASTVHGTWQHGEPAPPYSLSEVVGETD